VPQANSQPSRRLDLDRAVTLRQLRTFKTVADVNSFSLAATRLKLSQPSVSYQVKELEEAFGLPLIDFLKDAKWLARVPPRDRLAGAFVA